MLFSRFSRWLDQNFYFTKLVSKKFNFGILKSKISMVYNSNKLITFVYGIQRDWIFILWVYMINPKVNVHIIIQGQLNSLSLKIK